ncbi:hypothetical protein IQ268_01090 [Oculatella sp. LEGE 06141]|nr:hypothetical protein [Oculatella sp. LEGE 06141]MBE9177169.1 hypothetical protein [Oculatella sp. LEGE 06141]
MVTTTPSSRLARSTRWVSIIGLERTLFTKGDVEKRIAHKLGDRFDATA